MSSFIDDLKNKNGFDKVEITSENIREFADLYQEILDLKKDYANLTLGRKKMANKILKKIELLQTFLFFLSQIDFKGNFQYAASSINDYEMVMRLLLRLANVNGEKFILKIFFVDDFASFEIKHGISEEKHIGGRIFVMGEKIILDKIDDKSYFGSGFSKIADEILKEGYSLIIITDHYFPCNVKPFNNSSNKAKEIDFRTKNDTMNDGFIIDDLSCYLYDDEMKIAIDKLSAYISQNGADIKGIDENFLFDIMSKIDVSPIKKHIKKP